MKIRELLQTELWSKRTTQGILIGFALAVMGFWAWNYVDDHWLTRGEQKTAKSALVLIDSLQLQSTEDDQKDFEAGKQKAEQAVKVAEQAAWTTRDKQVFSALSNYLNEVGLDRNSFRQDKELQRQGIVLPKSATETDAMVKADMFKVDLLLSTQLHSVVDN
jgi:predicted negative regulator of RcsB-dependent stress response